MWFDSIFGGGASYPPNYWVFQARLNRAGRHPLYAGIIGVDPTLIPGQAEAAHCICGDPQPCRKPPLQEKAACPGDILCKATPTPTAAPKLDISRLPTLPRSESGGPTYWSCVFKKLSTVQITECLGCIIGGGSLPETGWKGGVSTAAACGACINIAKSCHENPNQ